MELALPRLVGCVDALEEHNDRLAAAARDGDLQADAAQHRLPPRDRRDGREPAARLGLGGLGIELWTTLSLRLHQTEIYSKSAEHAELIEAFRRGDPEAPQLLHDHVMNYAP